MVLLVGLGSGSGLIYRVGCNMFMFYGTYSNTAEVSHGRGEHMRTHHHTSSCQLTGCQKPQRP